MIRLRRRNTAWLVTLGAVIGFALLAGSVPFATQAALLALFGLAVAASAFELGRERNSLLEALKRAPLRQRISPDAREAYDRARSLGGYINNRLVMLDVGLIALQGSHEGMAMRRTRNASKDDDAVRPFITLHVDPQEAERNARVRFEIYNQYGERMYVYEMPAYLRDGELSVLAEHQLPLAGNDDIQGVGDWDLRVFVDNDLVAMHNFTLTPSESDRRERLAQRERPVDLGRLAEPADRRRDEDEDVSFEIIDEVKQETPMTLQELMRQQSGGNTNNRTPQKGR